MNKDQHTPGPWCSHPTAGHEMHGQSAIASEASGKTVAIAYDGRADAHLLAAAPEMLEALRAMVARGPFMDQRATAEGLANCEALAKARHAIRQAEATE
jgi:hypothetical protein